MGRSYQTSTTWGSEEQLRVRGMGMHPSLILNFPRTGAVLPGALRCRSFLPRRRKAFPDRFERHCEQTRQTENHERERDRDPCRSARMSEKPGVNPL